MDDLAAELEEEGSDGDTGPKKKIVEGKLFLIPRDTGRPMQVTVIEGDPKAKVEPLGMDMGKLPGKYVGMSRARTPYFFGVPYNGGRMLKLDPVTCKLEEVGKRFYGK